MSQSNMLDNELIEKMKLELPEIPFVFISSVAQKGLTELKDLF